MTSRTITLALALLIEVIMNTAKLSTLNITAVILAGGQSLRFGQQDKAWALINHRPMVQHIIDTLCTQASEVLINGQRDDQRYQRLGLRCIFDRRGGFQGPLAGIDATLQLLNSEQNDDDIVVFIPCDTPNIPNDLIERLCQPLQNPLVDICYAADQERSHYLCCALRIRCLANVNDCLDQDQRSMRALINQLNSCKVLFADSQYFANVNCQGDLELIDSDLEPA
jgi:molybdopterin-guanine dinucleotide biosynthesis protein A